MIEAIFGIGFVAMCVSFLFPEETETLKKSTVKAARLTGKQMSASAYTKGGHLIKAYRSQEEARRHRAKLDIGTVIYYCRGRSKGCRIRWLVVCLDYDLKKAPS